MVDLSELADPCAVWKAVEGDRSELIALLRSEKKLTRRTRDALADWLDGGLLPVKMPKGRPREDRSVLEIWDGHDPATKLGWAGVRYGIFRSFIRKKGWHLKRAGRFYWSSERLMEAIAKKHEIDLEKFINYLTRARARPKRTPFSPKEYEEKQRRKIAFKIRRAKIPKNG